MIRASIALLASLGVGVQAYFMAVGDKGACLNDGCEVVEQLTRISPLAINIAGLLFFQALFWLFLLGRKETQPWHKLARLLLLAALVAEAVLLYFQYAVARAFCSYCLIVAAVIVLLNLLCGLRQFFRGSVLFTAVLLTLTSLRFDGDGRGPAGLPLAGGSIAMVAGEEGRPSLHLFFSAACPHCEKVIEALREENLCPVRFNPVEPIASFSFPGATLLADYQPATNLALMQSLAITDIPILIATEPGQVLILRGEQRINQYLVERCRPTEVEEGLGGSSMPFGGTTPVGGFALPLMGGSDAGACQVTADCPEEEKDNGQADR